MSSDPVSDGLTWPVGAVAARLETSAATLRAWERRYGLAPSARTRGGHRRYTAEDVALLQLMRSLLEQGIAPADAARALLAGAVLARSAAAHDEPSASGEPTDVPHPERVRALTQAMHALDADTIALLTADALAILGAVNAWTRVFTPALTAIGKHWQRTERGVDVEHLTSGIMEAALRHHAQRTADATDEAAPVLLAAAPAEAHTLPLTALAAALAERHTPAILLGGLPARSLGDAIARLQPRATVLWARAASTADPSHLQHILAASPGPLDLHPAGPGWSLADLPAGTGTVLRDLPQAVRVLRRPGIAHPDADH